MSGRLLALAAVIAAAAAFPPAAHAAPGVTVLPRTTGLDPAGQTLTIRGAGFDPNANGGVGVYVVFGPKGENYATDAEPYQAAKWVRSAAFGGSGQSELRPDGTFEIALPDLKARYTDGRGQLVDCLKVACLVMTFTAHGVPDRSQDTFTPVAFDAGKPAPVGSAVIPYRPTGSPAKTTPSARPADSTPAAPPTGAGPAPAMPAGGVPTVIQEHVAATPDATIAAPIPIDTPGGGGAPLAVTGVVVAGLASGAGSVLAFRRRARRAGTTT